MEAVDGVLSAESGYTGGHVANPSYSQVSWGSTGHFESVKVTFDSGRIPYEKLLDFFWANVDPLDGGGQFCDRGEQYRSAIFYVDNEQELLARGSKARLEEDRDWNIETTIKPLGKFYPACFTVASFRGMFWQVLADPWYVLALASFSRPVACFGKF